MLELEPGQLDLDRFQTLRDEVRAARSRGDLLGASEKLRAALSLWRGPALADLAHERFVQLEAGRLEELRLAALEERVDVDLALGGHADLVPELERLVAEHPLREGFRAQLMLALYRSGRQAEALQVYHEARRELVEELGIEPSRRLRELEQAILRQDESLGTPVATAALETRDKPARPRRKRRTLVPIAAICAIGGVAAICAIGGVAAIVLLTTGFVGGSAATYRPGTYLLDLKNVKQTAFLPPSQLAQPTAPVYADGHFWLLNLTPTSFVELDPATGKVLTQLKAPDGVGEARAAQPFAVDRHALWVAAGDDLVKIDPRLRIVVDRFKLDKLTKTKGQAQGVALGGGLVWVGRDVGFGQVIALDPRTRRVRHQFDARHHVDLAFDDGIVWASDSGGVSVIDPATNHVVNVEDLESIDPFFGPNSTGNGVAAGGGFGWMTDPAKGLVYKIDRTGRVVQPTYRTDLGATGVSYNDGAVWVGNEDVGTVTRIDPVTDKQTVYRFGHPVAAAVARNGVLLAALEPGPAPEERIASLRGKVLRLFSKEGAVGMGKKPDPALDWGPAADQLEFATCANLLRHPDGPDALRLVPEVGAGMPTLSRDRRTYTFTIRRGYRFSPPVDELLTAETFRHTFERAASPKLVPDPTSAPGPGPMEDVQGFAAFRSGKARSISGLRVAGDQLSITLTKPSADFLQGLASPAVCPVPRGTPDVAGGANHSVGPNELTIPSAGPYYVAHWRKNKYVILKRNPNYHGPRPQRLDAIALREGVDLAVALDKIRHGGWDGIVSSGRTSTDFTDPHLDPGSPIAKRYGNTTGHLQYVPAKLPHTTYIALNAVSGPLADPTVRRAVAFAVDRTAIAPIWDSTPTDQLLPPVVGGFRERHLYPLHPDLAQARALMHGRRPELVMGLDPSGGEGLLQEARQLRAELGRIGIRLVFKHLQGAARDRALETGHPRIDLWDGGLIDGPDGATFLESVFVTTGSVPPRWLTPAVRRAVKRVNRLSGSERQAAAGALADRLLERDVPLVAIGNRVQGELFAATVGCRLFPPASHGVDLAALCRRDR